MRVLSEADFLEPDGAPVERRGQFVGNENLLRRRGQPVTDSRNLSGKASAGELERNVPRRNLGSDFLIRVDRRVTVHRTT